MSLTDVGGGLTDGSLTHGEGSPAETGTLQSAGKRRIEEKAHMGEIAVAIVGLRDRRCNIRRWQL